MFLSLPNSRRLELGRPVLVGILNVTPDSFSDGGLHASADDAVKHAARMLAEGVEIIDVGGESTRPGSSRIGTEEQVRRVVPIIHLLADQLGAIVSIDTTLAAVAEAALDAGASIINDTSAGRDDAAMLGLAAERGVPIILMHRRGESATMQHDPQYRDVVSEVAGFLRERAQCAMLAGVPHAQIVIDPGIGFGKTAEHNWTLLANLGRFVDLGWPVMLGASRKGFLGQATGAADPLDRAAATAATTALGVAAGVTFFRVHDVAANRHAADVAWAISRLEVSRKN